MIRLKLLKLSIAALVLLPCFTANGETVVDREKRKEAIIEAVIDELGLSAKQKNKLISHRHKHRKEIQKISSQIKATQVQLQKAINDASSNKDYIRSISNSLKALQAELVDARINGIIQVKEILDENQYKIFTERTQKLDKKSK